PYRLDLPPTLRWVEVDYPHVIEFKGRELANEKPRCQLERVKIDLADRTLRQEFLKSLNDSAKRILVITEGVVPYLTVDQAATLADDLNATPHIENWVVDYFSTEAMKMLSKSAMQERLGNAPFQFFPADWFAFFKSHGWKQKQMRYLAEEGLKTGRTMPLPWIYRMIMRFFVSGARKQAGTRWSGYALMERT
ncbi:MAG: class I SAM-dependent methyltransferase, partial [Gemmatimonadaceae bacterium]